MKETASAPPLSGPLDLNLAWTDPFPRPDQAESCQVCREEFYPGAVRQRLCTAACRRHAYLEQMRVAKVGVAEGCLRCGAKFMRELRDESPFCCMFCKWFFWRQTPESPAPGPEFTAAP